MEKSRALALLSYCAAAMLLLVSCEIETSGLGPEAGVEWDVEPVLFCPGDPVTVSWDFSNMPKSFENCRPRNGGYDRLMSCVSSSMCPVDGVCVDERCCRRDVFEENRLECPDSRGCYPDFEIAVTADTSEEPVVEGETRSLRGSRTVTPPDTTIFTINAHHVPPLRVFEEQKQTTMVRPAPETEFILGFPFLCSGTSPGWAAVDLNTVASENVRIIGTENISGHVIVLTQSPGSGPITLRAGETTAAFNGPMSGTWTGVLSPLDRRSLIVPQCRPTDVENPWPDLRVRLILDCAVDD